MVAGMEPYAARSRVASHQCGRAFEQAGAEEVMLQWLDLDDIDGLQAFAASVLPRV